MVEKGSTEIDQTGVLISFPATKDSSDNKADWTNPAIRLYGRRFYKDQTPVEYLAEFLLVFASPKQNRDNGDKDDGSYQLRLDMSRGEPCYWPEDRVALKLFAFFPTSKLETRHPVHRQIYLDALEAVKDCVLGSPDEKAETVRFIQSLLGGFIGVAKNRTWVTYSFLPASTALLSPEVTWQHPKALRKSKGDVTDWESSKRYFDVNTHNFLGRGGELLFLQLANLFAERDTPAIESMLKREEYQHLNRCRVEELINRLEQRLGSLLKGATGSLGTLVKLVEDTLVNYRLSDQTKSSLGWVPVATRIEALLFAVEMDNLCASNLDALEKLELLQTHCCMQVLRSLCFQARRVDEAEGRTFGFIGHYAWIVADPEAKVGTPIRQMAQSSFNRIDAMLYRALRSPVLYKNNMIPQNKDLKNGDDNCFRHFRKFAKEIGLLIPKRGSGQRFTLHQGLLRFLVAALVRPGERVRLTQFYQRVFAHYGIALGGQQLAVALTWSGSEAGSQNNYAVSSSTAWVEEALQQGGFLVELSDAVSIVHNPGQVSY